MQKLKYFLILARPYQWHKNVFIFAPAFFAGKLTPKEIPSLLFLLVNFIISSSSVYSINDVLDYQKDLSHPIKRRRPVASGKISKGEAIFFSAILALASLFISFYVGSSLFISSYIALNLIYSYWLKERKPLDIFIVSFGFILRVLAGADAVDVKASPWLVITTFFLAVFLSTMKREAEMRTKIYERIGLISATLTVASYSLYVILERKDALAVLSVLPVFYGIIRYYMIAEESEVRDPSVLIFDREIIISFIIWFMLIFWSLYS